MCTTRVLPSLPVLSIVALARNASPGASRFGLTGANASGQRFAASSFLATTWPSRGPFSVPLIHTYSVTRAPVVEPDAARQTPRYRVAENGVGLCCHRVGMPAVHPRPPGA